MSDENNKPDPNVKGKPKAKRLAADLTPVAVAVGATIVDGDRLAPQLDSRGQISSLARQCGQLLRPTSLFLRGKDLVTVDENTGQTAPMDATRFVSWAEDFVAFGHYTGDSERKQFNAKSISAEQAAKILAADHFRQSLRPLRGVHDVALPTWANAERTAVRLLSAGYDDATGIFTAPAFDYDTELLPDDGRKFLLETYRDFPFAGEKPLEKNRSFSVQVAAHFTAFCRLMLTDSLRPAFVFLANQSGSGKTLLARLALSPVFGTVSVESFPRGEEERGKQLTTLVAEGRPYAFYDNVKGHLSSAELEGFLTTPQRTGRILGQSVSVTAPNTAAVLISGNQLTLSADLQRRMLLCELFCASEATGRDFTSPITDTWPGAEETRGRFLAALWTLLDYWQCAGCPRSTSRPLATFESFSAIIGGIVTTAKFTDPLQPPENQMDETDQAWKHLLRALADKIDAGTSHDYDAEAAMAVAEELGVLEILTAGGKDERKTFGQRIKKWKGRRLTDNKGREFEFGNGRSRNSFGALYPVTVFAPDSPPPGA